MAESVKGRTSGARTETLHTWETGFVAGRDRRLPISIQSTCSRLAQQPVRQPFERSPREVFAQGWLLNEMTGSRISNQLRWNPKRAQPLEHRHTLVLIHSQMIT